MNKILSFYKTHRSLSLVIELFVIAAIPLLLAISVMGLWHWDLSVPMVYTGEDDTWQLVLTKVLVDTGWILDNPFLGAPDIAHWHYHSAAQTSALHSVIMLALSNFIDDAVRLQQTYYILNFSLISLSSYLACRLLGIAKFAAFAVALLFAFTTYRIGSMFLAYLSNYSAIPLALVPIFWIFTGEFREYFPTGQTVKAGISRLFRSKIFWISLACVLLVTLSDGYYAFFTLLLLGFATAMRAAYGDIKSPVSLLAPLLLIVTLISVALAMTLPLTSYQHAHREEFYPGGKVDPELIKRPMEAEVYSTSLKMLVAPIISHHIKEIGHLGQHMMNTSDEARKFPIISPSVPLGTIASILFLSSLIVLTMLILRQAIPDNRKIGFPSFLENNSILWAAIALSVFIFLSSISGGIGTLIALIYPTIRAYSRFPLFLIFCLFVGAGAAITAYVQDATKLKFRVAIGVTLALTLFGLYDQIPNYAAKGIGDPQIRFLAERSFVRKIEAALPTGAMVYQYPHSQYISNNKYYGWGKFSHIRLYLHSKDLRWSNGASKNSPVENWHERIASLPFTNLITEVEAAGFHGFMIDRAVVPQDEYQKVLAALANQGIKILEDAPSGLTFAELKDPGFRIVYDPTFHEVERLVVSDKMRLLTSNMPRLVNQPALKNFLKKNSDKSTVVIERTTHPEVFFVAAKLDRGVGEKPIFPLSDMRGEFQCAVESTASNGIGSDILLMTLVNHSNFDWKFNQGNYPIKIGVHLRSLDGMLLRWDDGFRVPTDAYIPSNGSVEIRFPLAGLSLEGITKGQREVVADFGLVQDGHAWFNELSCKTILRK
jgi:hypothetical protein